MANTNLEDLSILVVDNNVFIAKTLFSILDAFGVNKIAVCETLDSAEKKFLSAEIDCIFVDFMMDNRAGIDFIKKVRTKKSIKNDPDLPIILNTGMTDRETIVMARDAGVTEVIGKPFSPDQVLQKLNHAINNPREFIDVDEYVGPNRRRRNVDATDWQGDEDRRKSAVNNQKD